MYMDKDTALFLDDLRKRSRTLLAFTKKNSKKINNEIKRSYLQNSTLGRQNSHLRSQKEIWNLRNDSSAINDLLHSNCQFENKDQMYTSVSNMRPSERIVIPSKNLSHSHSSYVVKRKPVKECYCNVEMKKIQPHSSKIIHKPNSPCNYCKNHICQAPLPINENNVQDTLSPPISCETIRRVQKINYYPQSQFLRNVQRKVSVLKDISSGDCPDTCPRSSYYHKLRTDKTSNVTDTDAQSKCTTDTISKSNINDFEKLDSIQRVPSSVSDEEEQSQEEVIQKVNKGIQVPLRKPSKTKLLVKRTISSKKYIPEGRKEKSSSRSSSENKKTIRSSASDCQCYKSKADKFTKDLERKELGTYRVYPKDYEEDDREPKKWSPTCEKDGQRKTVKSSGNKVRELRKFREQNYFDTHGSSQTLLSSESSGSLQQYMLNDRLFAEPIKRIHKKDLVVTMPPCATVQKKRVHYFPRYVVRQEKSTCNTNYKKKRCQSCPLTGHAIDLGISKPRPVLNSLALKYQKKLP
ncbi:DNA ligase 1-like isoform X2 [Vespula squamosa]|uniref:DNA ligase 1-like isoform X2 n=1 Tax=Vespula squamosa TaxID=30214 RepID=A0ABD2A391_VESSQ